MRARLAIGVASAFLLALGAFGLLARGGSGPRPPAARRAVPAARLRLHRAADRRAAGGRPRAARASPQGYVLLAGAYAQRVRETGDAQLYAKAAKLLEHGARAEPVRRRRADPAERARALAPRLPRGAARRARRPPRRPGRRRAVRACSSTRWSSSAATARPAARCRRWSTASPTSPPTPACPTGASCTATSRGARRAIALARSAGGDTAENAAYVDSLRQPPRAARRPPRPRGARRALGARPLPRLPGRRGRAGARAGRARRPARRGGAAAPRRRRGCRCPSTWSRSARSSWPPAPRRRRRAELRARARRAAAARRAPASTATPSSRVFEADHGSPRRGVALGAPRLGGGAERALRRRARLGAHPRRPAA